MMDAAYFTGRKELLDFFNDLLELNLKKIEETAPGAIACQLTELIFPGSIPLAKVSWEARTDYEFIQNYKLLQVAFTKKSVQRYVDVDKLIRAKYQDNLEFCQWLKAFYDQSGTYRDDYDPMAARAKGKGGKKFNAQHGGASVSKARHQFQVITFSSSARRNRDRRDAESAAPAKKADANGRPARPCANEFNQ
jgi:RP/EB family microtubule-associated protein